MTLKEMLAEMLRTKASDLHLRFGLKPTLRIDGTLRQIETQSIAIEEMEGVLNKIITEDQKTRFSKKNEMDLALSVSKMGRFRINIYRQRGTVGVAIRAVNTLVPTFEELNLPLVLRDIANKQPCV